MKKLLLIAMAVTPLIAFADEFHGISHHTLINIPERSVTIENYNTEINPEGCYAFRFQSPNILYQTILHRFVNNLDIYGYIPFSELSVARNFKFRIVRQAPSEAYASFEISNTDSLHRLSVHASNDQTLEEVAMDSFFYRPADSITLKYYHQCPTTAPSADPNL